MNIRFTPETYDRLLGIANENSISIPALVNILLTRWLDNESDRMMFYSPMWHQCTKREGVWLDTPTEATFADVIQEYKDTH